MAECLCKLDGWATPTVPTRAFPLVFSLTDIATVALHQVCAAAVPGGESPGHHGCAKIRIFLKDDSSVLAPSSDARSP